MKWYNEQTGELSTACPCWPATMAPDFMAEKYPDWKEVPDDFVPPIHLEKLRQIKLTKLKWEIATPLIYEKAPPHKQMNTALGIYDTAEAQAITNWINKVRAIVNEIEAQILAATTIEALEAIVIDYNDIKTRAEAIDAQEGGI